MSTEHVYDHRTTEREPRHGRESSKSKGRTIPRPLVQTNRAFLVITILAALFISKPLLIIPLVTGLVSLVLWWNPVMAIGRSFLRKSPTEYRQEDRSDQRFNQGIATKLLTLSLGSFLFGAPIPGYIFSGMVVLAAGVALLGFCIGCYLHFKIRKWKFKLAQDDSV